MKTIRIALTVIIVVLNYAGYTQDNLSTKSKKAKKLYVQAKDAYALLKFKSCITILNEALEKDDQFIDAYLLKAEVYRNIQDFEKEAHNYKKSIEINPNYFKYQYFNLGTAQYKSGQYLEAKNSLNQFLKIENTKAQIKDKAAKLIDKCSFAIGLINHPVEFNPIDLGKNINNNNDQYWPSLSLDGKTLVFTELLEDSTKKTFYGKIAHQEDFYISYKEDDNWTKSVPLGPPINTPGNEGAQQLSADGNTLVFTGCNRKNGFGLCDIYFSYKTPNGWTKPINAGRMINSKFSEKQPSLSADGRSLYFSSNRPESIGGMDLYVSHKNAYGSWSKPKNLGRKINTHGDEISPYIHPDNQTFYFSSDGHMGMGECDIFISRIDNEQSWSKPQNIGYPINSYKDEIGLIVDNLGENAYFSSNRDGQSRNIYFFKLPNEIKPKPVSYVIGKVLDSETKQPLKANLELLSLVNSDTIMFLSSDSVNGTFLMCLPIGKNYALNANKLGYIFESINFNLEDINLFTDPYRITIYLKAIKPGESIVLENVFFATDSYELLPESSAELLKIEDFIKNNPNLKIEIGGHTDDEGSSDYNLQLSEKRAKAVYNYLLSKQINVSNLFYKGYGESNPVESNNTYLGKAKNRRTELKILE